jgi:shikimate kinase
MGSGKTVVGAAVAERAQAEFVDLDRMVEKAAGMSIPEIFDRAGEPVFRGLEKKMLELALRRNTVVALGGGTVMDDASWSLLEAEAVTVYLEVPFASLWRRVGHLSGRPLIADRSRDEVEAMFDSRRERYEQAMHRVNADRDPSAVAEEVAGLWSA